MSDDKIKFAAVVMAIMALFLTLFRTGCRADDHERRIRILEQRQ